MSKVNVFISVPGDELLVFGPFLQQMAESGSDIDVICCFHSGPIAAKDFEDAVQHLGCVPKHLLVPYVDSGFEEILEHVLHAFLDGCDGTIFSYGTVGDNRSVAVGDSIRRYQQEHPGTDAWYVYHEGSAEKRVYEICDVSYQDMCDTLFTYYGKYFAQDSWKSRAIPDRVELCQQTQLSCSRKTEHVSPTDILARFLECHPELEHHNIYVLSNLINGREDDGTTLLVRDVISQYQEGDIILVYDYIPDLLFTVFETAGFRIVLDTDVMMISGFSYDINVDGIVEFEVRPPVTPFIKQGVEC